MSRQMATWMHPAASIRENEETIARLAEMGINLVAGIFKSPSGLTRYPSRLADPWKGFDEGWEPWSPSSGSPRLADPCKGFDDETIYGSFIESCHRHGMKFEAWTCVFTEELPTSRFLREHGEYRAVDRSGTANAMGGEGWACPARPEVQEHELALCREVLQRYPNVDRLHLDYIRYPWSGGSACSCAYCQNEFRSRFGLDLLKDTWLPGAVEGRGFDAFVQWRCGHIERFVRSAREVANQAGVGLTAAVFPYYPSICFDLGQDWAAWCSKGLVDALYIMNYNWSPMMVGKYTSVAQHFLRGLAAPAVQIVQVSSGMRADELRAIAAAALDNGAPGLGFFSSKGLSNLPVDTLKPFLE